MNLNFLSPNNFFVSRWLSKVNTYSGREKEFWFFCKQDDMLVDKKRKKESKTKKSIGDNNMNLNVLSPIEFCIALTSIL